MLTCYVQPLKGVGRDWVGMLKLGCSPPALQPMTALGESRLKLAYPFLKLLLPADSVARSSILPE